MRPNESMSDKVRRMAMSDVGISDEAMTELQGEKLIREHLAQVAEQEGGEAAIRAAMRPRGAKKQAVRRPAAPTLAAEEALAERNIVGMRAAEQGPRFGPPGMQQLPGGGAIGDAMLRAATPRGRTPLMADAPPEEAILQALAQEAAPQEAPAEKQGLLEMIMRLIGGRGAASPPRQGGWQGPAGMQGAGLSRIQPPPMP